MLNKTDKSLASNDSKMISDSLGNNISKTLSKKMIKETISNPSKTHVENVNKMEQIFIAHHPKNSIKRGCGVKSNVIMKIQNELPHLSSKVVTEFVNSRTEMRVRSMNITVKRKKNSTLRNCRKRAEYVC